jgi:hypothetical protein
MAFNTMCRCVRPRSQCEWRKLLDFEHASPGLSESKQMITPSELFRRMSALLHAYPSVKSERPNPENGFASPRSVPAPLDRKHSCPSDHLVNVYVSRIEFEVPPTVRYSEWSCGSKKKWQMPTNL